jgi:hypothetical protein
VELLEYCPLAASDLIAILDRGDWFADLSEARVSGE